MFEFCALGGSGGDDDEDDDNDDIEYYAGGEKSGVAVKGGGKKEKVDGLFDSARKHGAVEGTEQDLQPRDDSMRAFTGTARTLSGGEREPEEQEDVSEQSHTITFYENDVSMCFEACGLEMSGNTKKAYVSYLAEDK